MPDKSSDSLIKIMIGKYQQKNSKKSKSLSLQPILAAVEKEENDPYINKQTQLQKYEI